MNKTSHYDLNKPEGTDFYNINDHNQNMDILDQKVYELESDDSKELVENKVQEITPSSTAEEYPSAKAVMEAIDEYVPEEKGGIIPSPNPPEGDSSRLWLNTTTGVLHYWTGVQWTRVNSVWG